MTKYENRIIGSGVINPKDIKKNPQNWRKHPASQGKALDEVLGTVGWIQEVIINKTTGNLIDGHLRVETAIKNNETEIPVKYVELTEDEERIALATFDPISAMAEQDSAMLKELLADIESEAVNMAQFFGEDVLPKIEHTEEELEAVPEVPKVAKTKRGDMYKLGEHVLMCGDSTEADDVAKLMGGGYEVADMVFTDPPYNVDYVGKTKDALKIQNDSMSDSAFREFLTAAFTNMRNHSAPGAPIYVCFASSMSYPFVGALLDAGWSFKQLIIWVKNAFVMGRSDYQQKHEPILYGWNPEGPHKWYGGRKQTTVWEIDRPMRNAEHPTMKPIALMKVALQNSSIAGDTVLDLFGGSGSTLIACEETGRKCRTMELAPEYCDVIVERWEKLTGKKAELISGE